MGYDAWSGFQHHPNLDYFKNIIPCGIEDKAVTSMVAELNQTIDMEEVKKALRRYIYALFEMND